MKAKYNSLRTSLFFSALLLSAGAASAEDAGRCSTANGAGRWGFTVTGTNTTGQQADAIVGSGTVDRLGKVNLTLTEVTISQPQVRPGTATGTVTVDPDCTGTLKLTLSELGQQFGTEWAIVYVDNQREIFGILKGSTPPSPVLPVQTLNAKMVVRGSF